MVMEKCVIQILKTEGTLQLSVAFEAIMVVLDLNLHNRFDGRLEVTALRLLCKVLPLVAEDCKVLTKWLVSYLLQVSISNEFTAFLWAQLYVICKALYMKGGDSTYLEQLNDKLFKDKWLRVYAIVVLGGQVADEKLLPFVDDSTIYHLVPGMTLTDTFL